MCDTRSNNNCVQRSQRGIQFVVRLNLRCVYNIFSSKSSNMSGGILGSIEKLKGSENYITWKIAVENLLCYEALDEFITKAELASGDAPKDKKAKSIITLTLDKSILIHIASCKTVKEVWNALQTTYEDLGLTRV